MDVTATRAIAHVIYEPSDGGLRCSHCGPIECTVEEHGAGMSPIDTTYLNLPGGRLIAAYAQVKE